MKFKMSSDITRKQRTLLPIDEEAEKFLLQNYKNDIKIILPNITISDVLYMFEGKKNVIILDDEEDNYFDLNKECWRYFRD